MKVLASTAHPRIALTSNATLHETQQLQTSDRRAQYKRKQTALRADAEGGSRGSVEPPFDSKFVNW